jgi:hypothetical protein
MHGRAIATRILLHLGSMRRLRCGRLDQQGEK